MNAWRVVRVLSRSLLHHIVAIDQRRPFRGHFTGRFGQILGHGQTVNFIATDIYRVADARVAQNWHIEDNLTLQQQLGLIPK